MNKTEIERSLFQTLCLKKVHRFPLKIYPGLINYPLTTIFLMDRLPWRHHEGLERGMIRGERREIRRCKWED
jgi:hypothetical protein